MKEKSTILKQPEIDFADFKEKPQPDPKHNSTSEELILHSKTSSQKSTGASKQSNHEYLLYVHQCYVRKVEVLVAKD